MYSTFLKFIVPPNDFYPLISFYQPIKHCNLCHFSRHQEFNVHRFTCLLLDLKFISLATPDSFPTSPLKRPLYLVRNMYFNSKFFSHRPHLTRVLLELPTNEYNICSIRLQDVLSRYPTVQSTHCTD